MLRRTPLSLRSLLLMSSALVPSIAWSQGQLGEPILMRGNTSVPIANTWYVNPQGQVILAVEMDAATFNDASQVDSIATVPVTIPDKMFQSVSNWVLLGSSALGGLVGGIVVGQSLGATAKETTISTPIEKPSIPLKIPEVINGIDASFPPSVSLTLSQTLPKQFTSGGGAITFPDRFNGYYSSNEVFQIGYSLMGGGFINPVQIDPYSFTQGDVSVVGDALISDFYNDGSWIQAGSSSSWSGSGYPRYIELQIGQAGGQIKVEAVAGAIVNELGQASDPQSLTIYAAVDYYAQGSVISVNGSQSDDELIYGSQAASNNGDLSIDSYAGNDLIIFYDDAAVNNGSIHLNSGVGDDAIFFASNAADSGGTITVISGPDNDTVSFGGDGENDQDSALYVDLGSGNDVFETFDVTEGGHSTVLGGEGEDQIHTQRGTIESTSRLLIDAGNGDDMVNLGMPPNYFSIPPVYFNFDGINDILLGAGADICVINADVGRSTMQPASYLRVDLGADLDADTIRIEYDAFNFFITNYSIGLDNRVGIPDAPSVWTGTDNGTDIVFTQSDQTITFEGLGGVGGSTDPLDYFM